MALATSLGSEALDSSWRVNVSGQVYGPYTGHQLKAFAVEGRIAAHSIVQAGDGPWITAIDDPVLGQLFVQKAGFGQNGASLNARTDTAGAKFVIIADLKSRASGPLEAAIARLGEWYRLNALVWLVRTDRSVGTIRNELIQHLGQTDSLVVVDATRGKSAWFNLGPEVDAKIRKVWQRPADKSEA